MPTTRFRVFVSHNNYLVSLLVSFRVVSMAEFPFSSLIISHVSFRYAGQPLLRLDTNPPLRPLPRPSALIRLPTALPFLVVVSSPLVHPLDGGLSIAALRLRPRHSAGVPGRRHGPCRRSAGLVRWKERHRPIFPPSEKWRPIQDRLAQLVGIQPIRRKHPRRLE